MLGTVSTRILLVRLCAKILALGTWYRGAQSHVSRSMLSKLHQMLNNPTMQMQGDINHYSEDAGLGRIGCVKSRSLS